MTEVEQCKQFDSRFSKLSDSGKQYIEAILQSLEFAQDSVERAVFNPPKSPRKPPENRPA